TKEIDHGVTPMLVQGSGFRVRNSEPETRISEHGTLNPKLGTRNSELGTRNYSSVGAGDSALKKASYNSTARSRSRSSTITTTSCEKLPGMTANSPPWTHERIPF